MPIYATVAVLAALAIGLTTVALVGSAQRRDDRAAYLRYERALLPSLKEGGRIVVQQIRPSLPDLSEGKIDQRTAIERASGWRGAFTQIQADVIALEPPSFLGDVERIWVSALAAYLEIPDAFQAAADAAGAERTSLLERAIGAGRRADSLFDRAASLMQAHRRRLGLGASPDLPDPASTS
ncbi:MAG: hypothetical protein ACRDKG_12930 [Actinomycetota bacterium]